MTKALKRAASVFLAILLIFVAFAAPITQPVKAVAVSAVVISAVLAAMAVWGVSTITAGMTAADIQDWVSTKLNDWASSKSSTVASLIPISGISVTATALLVLGSGVANSIKDFVSWLQVSENLQPGQVTSVAGSPSSFGGVEMTLFNGFAFGMWYGGGASFLYYRTYDTSDTIYVCGKEYTAGSPAAPAFTASLCSASPFAFTVERFEANGTSMGKDNYSSNYSSSRKYYYYDIGPIYYEVEKNNVIYYNNPGWKLYQGSIPAIDGNIASTVGTSLSLNTDVSYNLPADLTQPESLYLNTGAAIGATVEGVTDHVITGVVENTLDVSGTIAEEAPPYEVTGPVQVPGIKDIFPFCIPFDLYAFLACLSAEPEAPAFTWRIYVPGIVDEEIEVDLAPFNTVATILRTGLLLLFCVGLAFETRKLIRS